MARERRGERLPSKAELLSFLGDQESPPRMNELIQAFGLKASARASLKRLLRELEDDGQLVRRRGRPRDLPRGELPPVGVVEVSGIDDNGDLHCRSDQAPTARILLPIEALDGKAPAEGDRLLVRLYGRGHNRYDAHLLKLLPRWPKEAVGVLEAGEGGLRLRPTERGAKVEFRVGPDDLAGALAGDLVRVEVLSGRPMALPRAKVVERLGRADDPGVISLSIATRLKLPMTFSDAALAAARKARPVKLGKRKDLRELDLVTIDGEDARDFDDAVWAAADPTKGNEGGFRIVVAIADVAHYVRPDDALDRDARERGNSVYFPDRVIPMLPEELSNDLCSLRPQEERACVAALMRIDRHGRLIDHRFRRGLMRSRARLTYGQVQAAHDGNPDELTGPLLEPVIEPLYAAYALLAAARRARGTIELDLPERRILFRGEGGADLAGESGAATAVAGIVRRERVASHMLIEEFMILANVAAASTLEKAQEPALYRVHDRPDPMRLEALGDYLERIGVPWSRTAKKPGDFTALLERIADPALRETVAGFVLRSQAQAIYSPRNAGHFGLALPRYAHFTSPIRRYSDLVVHRALIKLLKLGAGSLEGDTPLGDLVELGAHLSRCERRAMEGERAAVDRFTALFLASRVGAQFAGKIIGVQRFGLFVALDETGAEGLVPVSTLGDDAFHYDERHHALVGQRWGEVFGLGDPVVVELIEADTANGSLAFQVVEHTRAKGAELARAAWAKGGGGGRRPSLRGRSPRRTPRR